MTCLHRQSAGNQLIVGRLVHNLFPVIPFLVANARVAVNAQFFLVISLIVNLIKGHPVFHFILIPVKAGHRKPHEKVNALPIAESAVFLHKMQRHLKMAQSDYRLYAILMAFVKHIIIELKPFFIRLCLITVGKNPGPRNAGAETLKSHLPKQFNILFIVVIKINRLMVWIIFTRNNCIRYPSACNPVPCSGHIHNT